MVKGLGGRSPLKVYRNKKVNIEKELRPQLITYDDGFLKWLKQVAQNGWGRVNDNLWGDLDKDQEYMLKQLLKW